MATWKLVALSVLAITSAISFAALAVPAVLWTTMPCAGKATPGTNFVPIRKPLVCPLSVQHGFRQLACLFGGQGIDCGLNHIIYGRPVHGKALLFKDV